MVVLYNVVYRNSIVYHSTCMTDMLPDDDVVDVVQYSVVSVIIATPVAAGLLTHIDRH